MMSDKAEKMLPNILKVRDDHQPVRFEKAAEDGRFKICDGFDASWAGEEFGPKELRGQIEPWLTALFQSEHLSLLAGSGLTHAVHYLARMFHKNAPCAR
ncbi:hypothetical protein ABZN20_13265 [Methylococcus sp. ANG]|uniref:hypothetical protein n=1 Tax=Methylococcus sp. ANG TaxID=3231903 RepID=UPI003459DB65